METWILVGIVLFLIFLIFIVVVGVAEDSELGDYCSCTV